MWRATFDERIVRMNDTYWGKTFRQRAAEQAEREALKMDMEKAGRMFDDAMLEVVDDLNRGGRTITNATFTTVVEKERPGTLRRFFDGFRKRFAGPGAAVPALGDVIEGQE